MVGILFSIATVAEKNAASKYQNKSDIFRVGLCAGTLCDLL